MAIWFNSVGFGFPPYIPDQIPDWQAQESAVQAGKTDNPLEKTPAYGLNLVCYLHIKGPPSDHCLRLLEGSKHMSITIPESILSISPYKAGKPLEELEREYGIKDSIKLASNENPLGPSPKATDAIARAMESLHRYPESSGHYLVRKLADRLGVAGSNIVLGNGSDEILSMLSQVYLGEGTEAIMPKPSFLMYDIVSRSAGADPIYVPLSELSINLSGIADAVTDRTRMVFLTNPNNPTGTIIRQRGFEAFLDRIPDDAIVVVDEAYIEFARDPDCLDSLPLLQAGRPLVILRTFSKAYGLAGLRIGYGVMGKEMAEIINRVRMPFNTSVLAQAGALAALDDEEFLDRSIRLVHEELAFLSGALTEMSIRHFPSQANFFLIDLERKADAVYERLLERGVIVRPMASYGFPNFIRVSVGRREENARFLAAMKEVL